MRKNVITCDWCGEEIHLPGTDMAKICRIPISVNLYPWSPYSHNQDFCKRKCLFDWLARDKETAEVFINAGGEDGASQNENFKQWI